MRPLALALLLAAGGALTTEAAEPPAEISDPHQLLRGILAPSTSYQSLTVFPERLVYSVSWGIIGVGQATLESSEIVDFGGRPAYHIVSRAESNHFCDAFYKVRDFNESWIDAQSLASLGYLKRLREGHFFRDEWVLFDAARRRFQAKITARDGSASLQEGDIPAAVQDILSSLFYVRSRELTVGSEVVVDVNTKQNWPLVVRVIKKETVTTPAGTFPTILVEPALRQEGIFIQKGRRLRVWLTDDARKVPVLMTVEVFFGHVSARLVKMI